MCSQLEKAEASTKKLQADFAAAIEELGTIKSQRNALESENEKCRAENASLLERIRVLEEESSSVFFPTPGARLSGNVLNFMGECSPDVSGVYSPGPHTKKRKMSSEPQGENLTCVVEAQMDDLRAELKDLMAEKAKLGEEVDDLSAKLDLQTKASAEKAKLIEDLTKERKKLQAELVKANKNFQEITDGLEARLAKTTQEKNELIAKLQDSCETVAELEKKSE